MRSFFMYVMIVGFIGMALYDLQLKNYKLSITGFLLALVQWLVFGNVKK